MSARAAIREIVPAPLRRWYRRRFGWRWMRGDYATWSDAARAASAAPAGKGVERAIAAARAVRAGRGAWERDGVVFSEPAVHEPLLRVLREIAAAERGRLDVVDFGGALGSTWWQHRAALADLRVRWRVVELPALVRAGEAEFASDILSFHETLEAALGGGRASAILFSSVLQYVPDPWSVLADIARRGVSHVILDRIGFVVGDRDRLVVQWTPPALGGGAAPCWLFARQRLRATLGDDYRLEREWPVAFDAVDGAAEYRGWHLSGAAARPS